MRIKAINSAPGYNVNVVLVERVAKDILKKTGAGRLASLEILFLGDKDIRGLNKRFKRRDRATDVLSFESDDVASIAISLDTASRNAKAFGTLLHEEASRYIIHGILHLFGYDDDTRANRLRMSDREDRILRSICLNTDLSKALTRR